MQTVMTKEANTNDKTTNVDLIEISKTLQQQGRRLRNAKEIKQMITERKEAIFSNRKSMENKLRDYFAVYPDAVVYLNVTNGLEAIPILDRLGKSDPHFVHIQSTHLEQKELELLVNRLGSDLMMNLALGRRCVVIDYGAKKEVSRAAYQGVPFIKMMLERLWFNKEPDVVEIYPRYVGTAAHNAKNLFVEWICSLKQKTRHYIKKYAKYANRYCDGQVRLDYISCSTDEDGHADYHVDCLSLLADDVLDDGLAGGDNRNHY